MNYDVIIVGAGPGGIFTAYELAKAEKGLKVAVFELGRPLDRRKCPIDGKKIKACVKCPTCSIMSGFGGAGGPFPTANTTSQTNSAALSTSMWASSRPLN